MLENKLTLAATVVLFALAPITASGQQRGEPVIVTNGFQDPVAVAPVHDFFQETARVALAANTSGIADAITEMVPDGKIGVIEFASVVSLTFGGRLDRQVFLEIRIVSADVTQSFGSVGFGSANLAGRVGASERTFLVVEPGDLIELRVNRNVSGFAEAFLVTIAGRLFDAGG